MENGVFYEQLIALKEPPTRPGSKREKLPDFIFAVRFGYDVTLEKNRSVPPLEKFNKGTKEFEKEKSLKKKYAVSNIDAIEAGKMMDIYLRYIWQSELGRAMIRTIVYHVGWIPIHFHKKGTYTSVCWERQLFLVALRKLVLNAHTLTCHLSMQLS